jgi:hypothetical protein
MKILEIKKIPFSIVNHGPKAQSVCDPGEKLNLNDFYINIQKQIKNIYETQRSIETQKGI